MILIVLVLHHHLSLKNCHHCLTILIIFTVVSFFPLSFLRLFFYWLAGGGGEGLMMTLLSPVPFRTCLAGGPFVLYPAPSRACLAGGGACSILLSSLVVLIQLLLR